MTYVYAVYTMHDGKPCFAFAWEREQDALEWIAGNPKYELVQLSFVSAHVSQQNRDSEKWLKDQTDMARMRMAEMMGLHPGMPETWPMEILDRLVWIEDHESKSFFQSEFRRIVTKT